MIMLAFGSTVLLAFGSTAYRILADLVVVVHLGFVLFVALGGLLALRWRPVVWAHLPAAVWGVLIELFGWTCPLTPLENRLRLLSGGADYAGGFIEHYLLPVLYPEHLTRVLQILLGLTVFIVNLILYAFLFSGPRRAS